MAAPKKPNPLEEIFKAWGVSPGLGDLFAPKPTVITCPVCGVKNRLKAGASYPKCGRCKTRLT